MAKRPRPYRSAGASRRLRTGSQVDRRRELHLAAWVKASALKRRNFPVCEVEGCDSPAAVVDHVIDRAERPDLLLDPRNLRSLCKRHHDRKTRLTQLGNFPGYEYKATP